MKRRYVQPQSPYGYLLRTTTLSLPQNYYTTTTLELPPYYCLNKWNNRAKNTKQDDLMKYIIRYLWDIWFFHHKILLSNHNLIDTYLFIPTLTCQSLLILRPILRFIDYLMNLYIVINYCYCWTWYPYYNTKTNNNLFLSL